MSAGGGARRILAIRPRALGDVVLTTPALRALARGHPGAALDVVTAPSYAPLLAGLPEVRRVLPLERTVAATARLAGALRRERYDVVVDFFGNARTALLARASGAPVRAGYTLRGRDRAYTVRVPRAVAPERGEREYAAAVHLRLARAVGGTDDGLDARVAVSPAAQAEADGLLAAAGIDIPRRTVGLVAAGTWATKAWPLSHAAALARRLEGAEWTVLVLVGPGEERIGETLRRLAPAAHLLPPCGVAALAAVIMRLGAVVGTDSGPRHLAAALGVPTFAWFGPTHPDTWGPPGAIHAHWRTALPCRACDLIECPHWACLPALAPADAAALVLEHLERHARPTADLDPAARA